MIALRSAYTLPILLAGCGGMPATPPAPVNSLAGSWDLVLTKAGGGGAPRSLSVKIGVPTQVGYSGTAVEIKPDRVTWSVRGKPPVTVMAARSGATGNGGALPVNPIGEWKFKTVSGGGPTGSVTATAASAKCTKCKVRELGAGFTGNVSGTKQEGTKSDGPAEMADKATFGDLTGTWTLKDSGGATATVTLSNNMFVLTKTDPGGKAHKITVQIKDGMISGTSDKFDFAGQRTALPDGGVEPLDFAGGGRVDAAVPADLPAPGDMPIPSDLPAAADLPAALDMPKAPDMAGCAPIPNNACNMLDVCMIPSAKVVAQVMPAAMGGAVVDGVYRLADHSVYGGAKPDMGVGPIGHPMGITLKVAGGSFTLAQRVADPMDPLTLAYSGTIAFDNMAKRASSKHDCGPSKGQTVDMGGYTVSGNHLLFHVPAMESQFGLDEVLDLVRQ